MKLTGYPFIVAGISWVFLSALTWLVFMKFQERFTTTKAQFFLRALCSASCAGALIYAADGVVFVVRIIYQYLTEPEGSDFDLWQAMVPVVSLLLGLVGCLATAFATYLMSDKSVKEAAKPGGRPLSGAEQFLLWGTAISNSVCAAALFALSWLPAARLSGRLIMYVGFIPIVTWALFALSIPMHGVADLLVKYLDTLVLQLLQLRAKTKSKR